MYRLIVCPSVHLARNLSAKSLRCVILEVALKGGTVSDVGAASVFEVTQFFDQFLFDFLLSHIFSGNSEMRRTSCNRREDYHQSSFARAQVYFGKFTASVT